ncbi:MAG: hypothetical protein JKX81_00830 [Arenicella sp.]|nr:hypothetical protein [Arenicella sp.]
MSRRLIGFGIVLIGYLAVCFSVHLVLYKSTLELSSYRTMIASVPARIHDPMSQYEVQHLSSQVAEIEFGGDLRALGLSFVAQPLTDYLEPTTFDMSASLALLNDGRLRAAQVKFDSLSSKIGIAYARRLQLLRTLSRIAGAVGLLLLLIFVWLWRRSKGQWSHEIGMVSEEPSDQTFSSFAAYLQSVVEEEVKFSGHRASLSCKGFDLEHLPATVREAAELIAEQLVRNSIEHGGRPAEQRLLAGKTDYISIRVTIEEHDESWLLSAWDNGEGLDGAAILQQAISLNLIDQTAADALAPEQRIRLIFLPGFSSRETAISVAENDKPLSQLRELVKRQRVPCHCTTDSASIANSRCASRSYKRDRV